MTTKKNTNVSKSSVKHKVLHLALGATLVGTSFATPLGNVVSAAEKNQDIQVDTEWLGQGDGSGVEFDVNLYSDKETAAVGSQTLNEENNWSHIFSDMPTVIPAADEDGTDEDITYTLKTTPLEDYYSVVTGNSNTGFTVLNMLKAEGEIQGQIVVRYVDQNGKEIAYRTIQSGRVNSDYAEIMPKEIKGYKNPTVTRGETTGNYEYGINIVEFTYEEAEPQEAVEGAIEVYHVDRWGNEIALRDMVSGEVDAEYSIEPKEITGYTLVTDFEIDEEEENDPRHQFYLNNSDLVFGGEINGQYEQGIHKVYFMYDVTEDFNADAPVRGGVIVKFQDTEGNEIAERHVQFGMTDGYDKDGEYIPAQRFDVGINWMENYIKNYLGEPDAESIRELGYGVIGVDGYTSGSYVAGFTEITYTLDVIKNDPGYENYNDVIVQHMDEYGNEIAVRDRVFAEIGSDYSVNEKQIKGYTFERVVGEREGKISDQSTVVQFIYSKDDEEEVVINGDVVVKHVDKTGTEIAQRDSQRGKLGEPYETEAKEIEGYEFVEVRGEANGVFGEGVRTIEYVYQLVEDEVTPPADEEDENNEGETPVDEDENNDENNNEDETPVDEDENNEDEQTPPVNEDEDDENNNNDDENKEDENGNEDEQTPPVDDEDENNNDNDEDVNVDLRAAFDNVALGMTYGEVIDTIGFDGDATGEDTTTINGIDVFGVEIFEWRADNDDVLTLVFMADEVISKELVTADGDVTTEFAPEYEDEVGNDDENNNDDNTNDDTNNNDDNTNNNDDNTNNNDDNTNDDNTNNDDNLNNDSDDNGDVNIDGDDNTNDNNNANNNNNDNNNNNNDNNNNDNGNVNDDTNNDDNANDNNNANDDTNNNDDATSNDDDAKATTNTNNNGNNNNGNNTQNRVQDAEANGLALPDTATNTFNLMAIGASLLALATGGLFVVNRRRKDDVETE